MRSLLLWATFVASAFATLDSNTGSKNANGSSLAAGCTNQNNGEETIKVHVGSPDGTSLKYYPEDLTDIKPGRIVEFVFHPKNHTVTESSFAEPCKPLAANLTRADRPGIRTGFVPIIGNETFLRTFRILINDTKPIWLYCGQPKGNHCQNGMVMVINRNTSDTAKTLEKYRQNAAQVPLVGASASTTVSASSTVTDVATTAAVTPVTSNSAGPALGTATRSASVSVQSFSGYAVPTQRPVWLGVAGGLAAAGVALL